MRHIIYFFNRKWWQIRNVFKWLPIIWNQYDFDYRYALDVFKFQLLKSAKFFESPKSVCLNANYRAMRIRTVIKLLDKVYDEDYACEWQQQIQEKYGNYSYQMVNNKYSIVWERGYTEEILFEIEIEKKYLFNKSKEKQEKAHKLLWKMIEKDIRDWWD